MYFPDLGGRYLRLRDQFFHSLLEAFGRGAPESRFWQGRRRNILFYDSWFFVVRSTATSTVLRFCASNWTTKARKRQEISNESFMRERVVSCETNNLRFR
mmetsp:Transcript_26836/g.48765  ORF Transcript_26836/g.48765 Transcript_26836/m.48765 type:complete len:100 (-) Transcript_26836:25-324(-)